MKPIGERQNCFCCAGDVFLGGGFGACRQKNAAELNSPVLLSFCRAEGNRIAFLPLCKNIIFFSFAALAFGAAGDIIFILLWKTFSIRFNPEKR